MKRFINTVMLTFFITAIPTAEIGAETDPYDFDVGGDSSGSEKKEKKDNSGSETGKNAGKITSADVFAFFEAEPKVTIASKKEQSVRDAPATVYVITEKMIRDRGYSFLHQALRDVPGIDINQNGPGLYGINAMMRGQDTPEMNKTLVFIDGVLVNNASQGVPYLTYQYSLHNVKQVEILWGPASALYGANAYAGVINIVTKSGKDIRNWLEFGQSYVSFDKNSSPEGYYVFADAGNSTQITDTPFSVIVSGHYVESDRGPSVDRIDNITDKTKNLSYTTPVGVIAHPIKDTYSASAKVEYGDFTAGIRTWSYLTTQGYFATYYFSSWNVAYWGFQGEEAYLKYAHAWTNKISTYSLLQYRQSRTHPGEKNMRGIDADRTNGGFTDGGSVLWYRREDYAVSLDNQVTYNWNNEANTTLGVFGEQAKVGNWNTNEPTSVPSATGGGNYTYVTRYPQELKGVFANNTILEEGTEPVDKPETQYTQTTMAGYLQHVHEFFNQLTLTGGGRVDILRLQGEEGLEFACSKVTTAATAPLRDVPCTVNEAGAANYVFFKNNYFKRDPFDYTTVSVNPRLGLIWKPTNDQTVKLLHGWAFRNPTVRERYSPGSSRIPSGQKLKPETIKTTELGYANRILKNLVGEIDAYWSEASDLIQETSTDIHRPGKGGTVALGSFQNVGTARFLGFELKLDAGLINRRNFSLIVFGNYSYQKHEYVEISAANSLSHDLEVDGDQKSSKTMPRVAAHKANGGITVYLFRHFVVSPSVQYVGVRPHVITSPIESIPPYMLVNLNLGAHDILDGVDMDVTVFNLLNYEANDPGIRDAKGDYYSELSAIPGFNMWVKMKVRI